ncbi:hypothetical protein ACHAXM_006397, partial [Skeletonema potamos]
MEYNSEMHLLSHSHRCQRICLPLLKFYKPLMEFIATEEVIRDERKQTKLLSNIHHLPKEDYQSQTTP